MNSTPVLALQLCPFSDQLEAGLGKRFDLVRWFELTGAEQSAFKQERGGEVRTVVTGGHIGCSNALIEALPALGIIAINGVGFDKVDLELARRRGVRVTTTPDVLTEDVADLAVGLIIALLRQVPASDRFVRDGRWLEGDRPLARKVTGRRFGIVGMGRIGSAIAARLAAFGPVAYVDPHRKDVPFDYYSDVTTLARACDVLVLASSANASTHHLVGRAALEALGPQGYLVNVARGSLIDEPALVSALADGVIAGAALDVFESEPNVPEALRASEKVVLTPHIASATVETRTRMAELVLENLDAFLAGVTPPSALV